MNGRTIAQIFLVLLLVGGAIGLGVTAYNAGVSAGLAQTGAVVVSPGAYPVGPYAGWGWGVGHGFGFFGFLGGLIFLFILIGLIRAAFGGSRRGWGGGPGRGYGHGWYGGDPSGWRDERGRSWEDRAREAHDQWHRSHPESTDAAANAAPSDADRSAPDRPNAG